MGADQLGQPHRARQHAPRRQVPHFSVAGQSSGGQSTVDQLAQIQRVPARRTVQQPDGVRPDRPAQRRPKGGLHLVPVECGQLDPSHRVPLEQGLHGHPGRTATADGSDQSDQPHVHQLPQQHHRSRIQQVQVIHQNHPRAPTFSGERPGHHAEPRSRVGQVHAGRKEVCDRAERNCGGRRTRRRPPTLKPRTHRQGQTLLRQPRLPHPPRPHHYNAPIAPAGQHPCESLEFLFTSGKRPTCRRVPRTLQRGGAGFCGDCRGHLALLSRTELGTAPNGGRGRLLTHPD